MRSSRSSTVNARSSRFEIELAGGMCSSEKFGQEHAHLPAVRAQRAVAGDTPDMGASRGDYEEVSKAELIEGLRSPRGH
jgi:hypothetical protein